MTAAAPFEFAEPDILPEELRLIRAQIRRYVDDVIVPQAGDWEEKGEIPRRAFADFGRLGFLGMRLPVEHGGGGLGAMASVVLGEELARSTYGGVAAAFTVHSDMSVSHIAQRGTPEQKARWLPRCATAETVAAVCVTEPHAGSDVAGIRTRARRRDDGGWVVDGSKTFITNGVFADLYIVAARTEEGRGSKGISLFVVERGTPGLEVARKLDKHGWRSSDTAELYFDGLRLPADALLGEEGRGFYYIMSAFQNERLVLGALATGICQAALAHTVAYLRERQAFGKSLWEQPVVRSKVAMLAARAAAARAFTYQCAQMIDEGQDAVRELSMLKALAAETALDVVHDCLQLHGGTGYMIGTPIERMARDVRILTIGGGATEVMLEEVAKRM